MAVKFQGGKAVPQADPMVLQMIKDAQKAKTMLQQVLQMGGALTEEVEMSVKKAVQLIDRDIADWRSEIQMIQNRSRR